MAVSFREGDALALGSGDPETLNPGTDPVSGDILIAVVANSATSAGNKGTNALASDSFGGTWTEEHDVNWGARRWLNVFCNNSWTTATGTVDADYGGNQDTARLLEIVEGAGAYTEDAVTGSTSGSSWTPTLTGSKDGHMVVIQMESTATISTPSGWTKVGQVTDTGGLRSLAVYTIVGALSDTTPTFSWSGTEGFTGWSAYFDAAAGGTTYDETGRAFTITTTPTLATEVQTQVETGRAFTITTTPTVTDAAIRPELGRAFTITTTPTIGVEQIVKVETGRAFTINVTPSLASEVQTHVDTGLAFTIAVTPALATDIQTHIETALGLTAVFTFAVSDVVVGPTVIDETGRAFTIQTVWFVNEGGTADSTTTVNTAIPFEYEIRADQLVELDGEDLVAALEKRDRELEDYLAKAGQTGTYGGGSA